MKNEDIELITNKEISKLQGHSSSKVSKLVTFMEVLKSLEGEPKSPVLKQTFIDELLKSEKFDESKSIDYIV